MLTAVHKNALGNAGVSTSDVARMDALKFNWATILAMLANPATQALALQLIQELLAAFGGGTPPVPAP